VIIITARWTEWEFPSRERADKIVKPTPGRDRPIVTKCTNPATAAVIADIFTRLGCIVTKEETP